MNGLLIYDTVGAKRNEWFIGRLISSAKAYGRDLELVITDGEMPTFSRKPDFAIVRTIAPALTKQLESIGIKAFNNSRVSRIANDKFNTYLFAKDLGVPTMATVSVNEKNDIPFPFPYVLKTVDGHGGSEVFLVKNAAECKELFSKLGDKHLIAQPLSSEIGVDMRVYILGGNILGSVCRRSRSDFRSNFSLGGEAELISLSQREKETVERISLGLGADFIGVDFIRHNGSWVLNEIEDVVGTRMLYSLTDIDAADVYIKHVIDSLKKQT